MPKILIKKLSLIFQFPSYLQVCLWTPKFGLPKSFKTLNYLRSPFAIHKKNLKNLNQQIKAFESERIDKVGPHLPDSSIANLLNLIPSIKSTKRIVITMRFFINETRVATLLVLKKAALEKYGLT